MPIMAQQVEDAKSASSEKSAQDQADEKGGGK